MSHNGQPQMPNVEIKITFNPNNGEVNVSTGQDFLANHILMFGILEKAKEAVRAFKPEEKPQILVARGNLPAGPFGN